MGFANLLHNENLEWWGSRHWLKQAGIWLLILNGMVALVMFVTPAVVQVTQDDNAGAMDPVSMGIQVFFQIGATALAIGTIIKVQGEVIGERQSGITEWILSKPVARPAYLMSKIVAHSIGVFVIMVGFQSAVAYGLLWLANGDALPLLPFLIGVGGLALHTFFYLTLTMMMGVFAKRRSQVLGVATGSLFGGMLLPGISRQLGLITPWSLPSILPALAMQIPLPLATAFMPILMTAIWSIVFVVAALWKLPRLEF
jgi:ABC-2 type transport system permease protein